MTDTQALILIILLAILVVIQVGALAGLFISLKKLALGIDRLRANVDSKIDPAVTEFREVLAESRQILRSVQTTAENFVTVSETVKYQVERLNAVIEDTTDRAKDQIARADEVVTDAIEKMEATSAIVQQNVLTPIHEVSALIRGVSGGLHFLFGRRRNQVDAVHQDEELFI